MNYSQIGSVQAPQPIKGETGKFQINMHKTGCPRTVHTPSFDEEVLQPLNDHWTKTRVAHEMNANNNLVWNMVHKHHSFRTQKIQALIPNDYLFALNHGMVFGKVNNQPGFSRTVLFTAEASFKNICLAPETVMKENRKITWSCSQLPTLLYC